MVIKFLDKDIEMKGVNEYHEGGSVFLGFTNWSDAPPRLVIRAFNECGYNQTEVDLLELVEWIKKHKPELLNGN